MKDIVTDIPNVYFAPIFRSISYLMLTSTDLPEALGAKSIDPSTLNLEYLSIPSPTLPSCATHQHAKT